MGYVRALSLTYTQTQKQKNDLLLLRLTTARLVDIYLNPPFSTIFGCYYLPSPLFFERNTGGKVPTMFLIIRTQVCVYGNLNFDS
jgi:hypothetical protein